MLWAALAILGVPIWLILGALAIVLWNRRKIKKQPGIFAVKLRLESGSFPGFKDKAATGYCEWVHDVLLVHKGLLMATSPVPVAAAEEPKRLGDKLMYLRFRLDDGSILQMSDLGENGAMAQGPFIAESNNEAAANPNSYK